MKILYLSFYFEPDLCPGSFRNTALVNELANQLSATDLIHVVTPQPNRYQSFKRTASGHEIREKENACRVIIDRVTVPTHASGRLDQMRSFLTYFRAAHRLTKDRQYDLVFASSSRLFTAFLGARLARKRRIPLVLDIRDLLRETIVELFSRSCLRFGLHWVLSAVERYTFGYARHINLVSEGFRDYFTSYSQATYSYFTNGIDEEFLNIPQVSRPIANEKIILYAGNIGEGQGLHKIIPQAARMLGDPYRFVIIGAGGAQVNLEQMIRTETLTNVRIYEPMSREKLVMAYQNADYLLVHLNDLEAFKRVLPSKLFEYGAMTKPILAGVAGYAAQFIQTHISNTILFEPGDAKSLVAQLRQTPYRTAHRADFVATFRRKTIMQAMAEHILKTVSSLRDKPYAV
ncbi:glycosyltransferase family 4 protein [Spirosoma oryzicola]|uniref:glycosyltransferase family 4 protein n=1 Tax=Spirosoma oryzicola TaxID=2898794 RepID=UPI001E5DE3FB|nr:glycosyltransferase family 4 protein [Spirosoma oryzicola]UHG92572.1 glycosyltransferase family 4 protein [Spirosoma oryzicola]